MKFPSWWGYGDFLDLHNYKGSTFSSVILTWNDVHVGVFGTLVLAGFKNVSLIKRYLI